jgi:hypothetical protein
MHKHIEVMAIDFLLAAHLEWLRNEGVNDLDHAIAEVQAISQSVKNGTWRERWQAETS